jgi:hypothetical protein
MLEQFNPRNINEKKQLNKALFDLLGRMKANPMKLECFLDFKEGVLRA